MSAARIHLVRHGEVENPHSLVYADLPGYALSAIGREQAAAVAARLAGEPVAHVVSSPLLRARQTAEVIASPHGLAAEIDERLTEWALGVRWAGVAWDDLERIFPGELTAYLEAPGDITFGPETLRECAERVAAAAREWAAATPPGGHLVLVAHQDPIHAGHLLLIGAEPADYHAAKPEHAAVVTLAPDGNGWHDAGYWAPPQGRSFPPVTGEDPGAL